MIIKVFDGYDCIGGNKILVADKHNDGFMLDFGLNFSKWFLFFEEYLKPRSGKILHDLLKLNMIPRINIYRKDLQPPEFDENTKISFLFLSHAHADHCGMIGLIDESLPLLVTGETFAIMKAGTQIRQDVWDELYPKKRKKVGHNDDVLRHDILVAERNVKNRRKISLLSSSTQKKILEPDFFEEIDAKNLWKDELYIQPVYHSIIGSAGLIARVDDWWVAYTGDFRTGPESVEEENFWLENLGEKRVQLSKRSDMFFDLLKNKKPLLLIVEGTRTTRQSEKDTTEWDVFQNVLNLLQNTNKLVIADFSMKHLERLMTFLKVAIMTERTLVVMPKDYAYLETMGEVEPLWKLNDTEKNHIKIYHPAKSSFIGLEKKVVEKAKKDEILLLPDDINHKPSLYILAAGYWDIPNILDLNEDVLENCLYIHSTSEAYSEEQQIDFRRFKNWIDRFSIKSFGFGVDSDGELRFSKQFHASGHVSAEKLSSIINTVSPDLILPVHTLDRSWFVERWGRKVINGNKFHIS
ncbi:ribonuclease J [Pseudothermotoga sp.]|uniref:ribonuclease J n=1 Tax=Pseudothermotoga sp. TaxID=2033661 RepID=UPI0025881E5F|nr:ribonuclease J [Pseudothermotoga sp.]MDK2884967.1 ribonuclease [Pseudothermotoga sp.]